jgi:hypothetical protein
MPYATASRVIVLVPTKSVRESFYDKATGRKKFRRSATAGTRHHFPMPLVRVVQAAIDVWR